MRTVRQIAREIRDLRMPVSKGFANWKKCTRSSWYPYLEAMLNMENVTDQYGAEDGVMIILYFLSNSTTWRGPDARRIKAELNSMLEAVK